MSREGHVKDTGTMTRGHEKDTMARGPGSDPASPLARSRIRSCIPVSQRTGSRIRSGITACGVPGPILHHGVRAPGSDPASRLRRFRIRPCITAGDIPDPIPQHGRRGSVSGPSSRLAGSRNVNDAMAKNTVAREAAMACEAFAFGRAAVNTHVVKVRF